MKSVKLEGTNEVIRAMKIVIQTLYDSAEFGGCLTGDIVSRELAVADFLDVEWRGIVLEDDPRFDEADNLSTVLFDLLAAREAVIDVDLNGFRLDNVEEIRRNAARSMGLTEPLPLSEEFEKLRDLTGVRVLLGNYLEAQLHLIEAQISELRDAVYDGRDLSADLDFAPIGARLRILRAVNRINRFRFFQ